MASKILKEDVDGAVVVWMSGAEKLRDLRSVVAEVGYGQGFDGHEGSHQLLVGICRGGKGVEKATDPLALLKGRVDSIHALFQSARSVARTHELGLATRGNELKRPGEIGASNRIVVSEDVADSANQSIPRLAVTAKESSSSNQKRGVVERWCGGHGWSPRCQAGSRGTEPWRRWLFPYKWARVRKSAQKSWEEQT